MRVKTFRNKSTHPLRVGEMRKYYTFVASVANSLCSPSSSFTDTGSPAVAFAFFLWINWFQGALRLKSSTSCRIEAFIGNNPPLFQEKKT